ncbi:glycosyltransferase 87 family protein [Actinomadura keratinilytica]|uniref:Glycosyltransferase 87 family protein n=1 Tax=Actinomadura keratinilytica TaxID=547461 RepID=A0ABP7YTC1_9ACTN
MGERIGTDQPEHRRAAPAPSARAASPANLLILAAGICVAVAAVAPIVVHWLTNPPDQRMVDLEVYRDGGRAVLRGAPLYEVLTQPPQLLPFTYPPIAAAMAVPFTLMSWGAAQVTWMVLLYVALAIVVWLSFRDLIRRAGRWAPLAAGALIGAAAWLVPVYDQARFGQVGLFLLAMCLADCCVRTPRWPRGMLVGLAAAIKLVPGVFLIYFWITGRRDAAANAVLTAAVAGLAGFALLPDDSVDYWFGALLEGGDRTGAVNGTTNQAINGMLARLYLPGPITGLLWLALVAFVGYHGFRLARRATLAADAMPPGPDARSALLAGVAITGLLSVLLSPVGWIHHLVWIIPVIGAVAGDGRNVRRCLFAGLIWLYFLFPLPWWGTRLIGPDHSIPSIVVGRIIQSSFGLAALALIVLLGRRLIDRVRMSGRPVSASSSRREDGVGTLTP